MSDRPARPPAPLTLAAWAALSFAERAAWRGAHMRPAGPGGACPEPSPLREIVGWIAAARTGDTFQPTRQREVLACGHLGGWRRVGAQQRAQKRCSDCAWGIPPFADLP